MKYGFLPVLRMKLVFSYDRYVKTMSNSVVDKGIVIVNVSQCMGGSVQMSRYGTGCKLEDAGVVSGYDSTTEAVLTKLMFLFGHRHSAKVVIENMNRSLSGEITLTLHN